MITKQDLIVMFQAYGRVIENIHAEGGDLSDYSDDEVNDMILKELKPKTIRCTACEIDFTDEKDLIVNSIVDDFTGTVEYDEVCPHCNTGEHLIDLPKGAI